MFIIVGHNRDNQQVMVHDTSDHTTVPTSYDNLRKVIDKGYLVKGIDAAGQIICNEPDVLTELNIQLQPVISKIILLKLDAQKAVELIFPICEKYGLVEDYFDLAFKPETFSGILYLIGKKVYFTGKQNKTIHSVKYTKDFDKIEDEEAQYLLQELYKIPFSYKTETLIIKEIRKLEHTYYIRFVNEFVLAIPLKHYDTDYIPILDKTSPAVNMHNHYLRKLAKHKPEGPYFISDFNMQYNYPTDLVAKIVYSRHTAQQASEKEAN